MTSGARIEASRRVVDETRRLYSGLLSQPLDEKQLARPTFKFIQEIAKSLITETKTLRKVFNPSDFESDLKQWDKRRRADFIQKLIEFAANHKQPVVGCVAAKLVAGLEPNKCNELLQALAKIAQAQASNLGPTGAANRPRTFTKSMAAPAAAAAADKQSRAVANAGQPVAKSMRRVGARLSIGSDKSSRQSSAVSRGGSGRQGGGEKEQSPVSSSPPKGKGQQLSIDEQTAKVQIRTETAESSQRAIDATNDDEMEEHIQVLRMSLKQFKTLILDIGELEHTLKSKLD